MVDEDELEGFFVAQRVLNAIDSCGGIAERGLPVSESRNDCAIRGDQNWLGQRPPARMLQLGEFDQGIGQVHSDDSGMQTQLCRRPEDKVPLQGTAG